MKSLICTAALALFFAPTLLGPGWAALGDTSASLERDRIMMKGQRHSRTGTPDLHLLLGEYFEEYREGVDAARSRRPKIRKPFQLKSERLVVERRGHSRSSWGRAYLPAALPAGVTPEDIQ
jgi:hypothetical protein